MTFLQDLRHAARVLLRQPLFTAVSVLVLGLGIGANTAVFNVVNTVLLRPLTYPQADRLMFLHERTPDGSPKSVSILNYLDWQAEQRSFTDLGLVRQSGFNVSVPGGVGEPERLTGATVTANYIPILGIPPALGRNFTPAEDTPGGPPAVIISDALWRRQFAASPDVLGRSVVVDGVAREIVGVLPWAMRSPRHADVYIPLGDLRRDASRSFHDGFSVAGRLRDGVTPAQARDGLNALALALEKRYPDTNTGWRIRAERMIDESVGEYRASLYLLFGAVACVLLIACANVANLQLARAAARTRELAVRAALGASRARLVRQLLTESALVGVLGGAAGLLLALWATDAIRAVGPADIPRFEDLRMDWQSLWFAAAAALVSGGLVGAWPAWRVTRTAALAASLHDSSVRGSSGGLGQGRARAALAVAQLALTVALLAGAGLALKSFWRAWNAPFGFRRDGMLMVAATLPEARYNDDQTRTFYAELLARVRSLPGVEAAATTYNMPFDVYSYVTDVHLTGTPPWPPGNKPQTKVTFASTDFFRVMGMPILRGRAFGPEDRADTPKTILVDEAFARQFFTGENPLGQQVDDPISTGPNPPPFTVVGVVGHLRAEAPSEESDAQDLPRMYVCEEQVVTHRRMVVVRAAGGDPLALAAPVRRAVTALDPNVPVSRVATMEQNIATDFAPQRLVLILLASFAVLALVLASLGLYGVMALGVAQRTRELGIRLALGAQRANVLRLVLGQSARLVGVGLALGLVVALGAGRLLAGIVYGVSAVDPGVLGLVALGLGGVGMLASYLPARRATKIDPLAALREE